MEKSTRITIAQASILIPGISLAASVFYDWGFFTAIGISFAETPTTVSDHVRSWLVWLPYASIFILGSMLVEIAMHRIERGMTENEIVASSPDPKKTARYRDAPFQFLKVAGILGIILWILFGWLFIPAALIGAVFMWFMVSAWLMSYPAFRQLYSAGFQTLFNWVPPILILLFLWGFIGGLSIVDPKVTHRLHIKTQSAGVVPEDVSLLRSFENYLLVQNENKAIVWVKIDAVHRIEKTSEESRFEGLACFIIEDLCQVYEAD